MDSSMTTSAAGRAAITRREGKRLTAYQDSVGVWTIGVGHTSAAGSPAVRAGMTVTAAEADAILARDLAQFEDAVRDAINVRVSQGQFDALVSLAFNIGAGAFARSTVVKRLNAGDVAGAAEAILMWNKAGGQVLPGLVNRRKEERAQFLAGIDRAARPAAPPPEEGTTTMPPTTAAKAWAAFLTAGAGLAAVYGVQISLPDSTVLQAGLGIAVPAITAAVTWLVPNRAK